MARIVIFCVLAPFALMEMLLYHRYDVAVLGALYLGMSMQADYAANQLMKLHAGKQRRHWSDSEKEEEIVVAPLGEKPKQDNTYYPPPARPEPLPLPEPPLSSQRRAEPRRKAARGFAALPNFRGPAHEVLGIHENAATRTIVHAFRHWIKRFHPDQAQQMPAALANAKVRQLTDAKERLLERRKSRRAA